MIISIAAALILYLIFGIVSLGVACRLTRENLLEDSCPAACIIIAVWPIAMLLILTFAICDWAARR